MSSSLDLATATSALLTEISRRPLSGESVKRRLTTILAADVVSFSSMMAMAEEATLAILDERLDVLRALLPSHNGRLFKTMGDGVLIEFNSPVEAVRLAIEFQNAMRTMSLRSADEPRMRFRIGINIGDVTVKDGDLLGDGVNVATRLQTAAPPEGICVSNGVFEHLIGKLTISSEDLGLLKVENIPRPIHAHILYLEGVAPARLMRRQDSATATPRGDRAEKLTRRRGHTATATTDADEIRTLMGLPHGGDALALLLLLRIEQGDQWRHGETIAICSRATWKDAAPANWPEKRIHEARAVLLEYGFIREKVPATRNIPAQCRRRSFSEGRQLSSGNSHPLFGERKRQPPDALD
jgi:class 3 adenylate cyclase